MPLIDLQRRLAEVGRIRMGEKGAKGNPVKRETWRLTSRDRARMEAARVIYPGELRGWNNNGSAEWELLTETDSLNVMVLPGQTLSQWYEMWSGGGCQRRCDGARMIVPDDAPCVCPEDHEERAALAGKSKACKATTRLTVLLPDVQGLGSWRLETHGYYAAVELSGIAEFLERATATGAMLSARLRIDQRTSVKSGQTRRYPVPVLEVEATPFEIRELAAGTSVPERPALPSPVPPDGDGPHAGERLLASTRDEDIVVQGPDVPDARAGRSPGAFLSDAQRRKVFASARAANIDESALREVLERVTGQSSTAAIPRDQFEAVLTAIEEARKQHD